MSLTRRLQRLVRAQIGSLRGDPLEDEEGTDRHVETDSSRTSGSRVPAAVAEAYRALEVPVGSDRETVKKGYRRVMKAYHQDRFDRDDDKREVAGEVSKRLNLAYERILEYLDDEQS